jgi:hypothetical protein
LFSGLPAAKSLGWRWNQTLGYHVLAYVTRWYRSIQGWYKKKEQPVGMWFCSHADVWDVRKSFSVSQIYWIIISSLGIIGGLELWRILGSLWKEKREMRILNIGVDTEQLRTFHILDSLRNNSSGKKEEETLQKLLLKHFEGKSYENGRITTNIAEAIFIYLLIIFIFMNWSRSLGKKTWKIAPASRFFLEKSFFQTQIRLWVF